MIIVSNQLSEITSSAIWLFSSYSAANVPFDDTLILLDIIAIVLCFTSLLELDF